MKTHRVSSLEGYIRTLSSITSDYVGSVYIYRGQSNRSWTIKSGAKRRVENEPTTLDIKNYHIMLVAKAKERKPSWISSNASDLSVLIELQHFGAATMLIDLTYDALIALFFACSESHDVDGSVYCFELMNAKQLSKNESEYEIDRLFDNCKGSVYSINPSNTNDRIVKQSSIFLFSTLGEVEDELFQHIIYVNRRNKEKILEQLKSILSVDDIGIYPDFVGFAQANSANSTLSGFYEYIRYYLSDTAEEKILALKQLIVRVPYAYDYWIDLGELKLLEDEGGAANCFYNAIQLAPNSCEVPLRICRICIEGNKLKLAIKFNYKALECNPFDIDQLVEIADNFSEAGLHNDAVNILEKIIVVNNTPAIHALLGLAYHDAWIKEDNKTLLLKSIQHLEVAKDDDPNNGDSLYYLGRGYFNMEDNYKALSYLMKSHEISQTSGNCKFIGIIYYIRGEYKKADKYLLLANKFSPNDVETLYYLGSSKCWLMQFKRSEFYIKKGLQIDSKDYQLIEAYGLLLWQMKKFNEAIELYEDYLSNHSNNSSAIYNLGYFYLRIGALEKAYRMMDQAIDVDQKMANAWSTKGLLYLLKGDIYRAEFCIDKAMSIECSYSVCFTKGHLLLLKQDEEYIKWYISAYLLDTEHTGFFDYLNHELRQLLGSKFQKKRFDQIKKAILSDDYNHIHTR